MSGPSVAPYQPVEPGPHVTPPRPNPYVGPRPFRTGEALFGRDREVRELLDLLIAQRIVLLYSPSGAGKTSLLQAGLVPRLAGEDFRILPAAVGDHTVVRVNTAPLATPDGPPSNRYVLSVLLALEEGQQDAQRLPLAELAGLTLSAYLNRSSADEARVIIFDQFEEVLTTDPTDQDAKRQFFLQLGTALRDPRLWALFAMREDHLAGLDPYLRFVPTRLGTRYRLDLLGAAAARAAITEPSRRAGVEFTPAAAEGLVSDLCRVQVQRPDGALEVRPGPYVEPVQLQVVCYRLWEHLTAGDDRIAEDDLAQLGSVDHALAGYYDDVVRAVAETTGVTERAIREWFSKQLITREGVRGQILKESQATRGLPNEAIDRLIGAHLVRQEERRGLIWYELTHDRLMQPVRRSNEQWLRTNLGPLQHQAALWEERDRPRGLLLRDRELQAAERWAADRQHVLTPVEHQFLTACRDAQRAIDRERLFGRIIVGALVCVSVACLVAIWLFFLARQQTQLSFSRELAASAQAQLAIDPALGTLLAIEAVGVRRTEQAEDALRQALLKSHARAVMRGHTGRVVSAAFAPDGRRVVTASWDGTARVWDVATAGSLLELRGHAGPVESATFSPDGRRVATASWDGAARVWEAQTGALLHELAGAGGRVDTVEFSPDGRLLIAAGSGPARLWEVSTGGLVAELDGQAGGVTSATFSPNGRWVATASQDTSVQVWELSRPTIVANLRGHAQTLTSAAFSADGALVLTASWDGTARVWEAGSGREVAVLRGHGGAVNGAAFSPDGALVVTASEDGAARVWEASTGVLKATMVGHTGGVTAASFRPDGRLVATASWDGTARVWEAGSGREVAVLRGHTGPVVSASFGPDGRQIVTVSADVVTTSGRVFSASGDNTARVWDSGTVEPTAELRGHTAPVRDAAFSPDGALVVTASQDGTARVWEAGSGREVAVLRGHEEWVTSAAFSPDGRRVATAAVDGTARVWEAGSGREVAVLRGHEESVGGAAFSADGALVLTASWDGTARVWEAGSGREVAVLRGRGGAVNGAAFSPDGRRVATAAVDGTARVWEAASGREVAVLRGHEESVEGAAFAPDGRRVVTASRDGTARVWEAATGRQMAELRGHTGPVDGAAFSSDGRRVLTASQDGTARVWEAATGRQMAELRGHGDTVALTDAAFSPDGRWVVTASLSGTARVWEAATGRQMAELRGHGGAVNGAAFSPDGALVVTASQDGTAQLYSCAVCEPVDDLLARARARLMPVKPRLTPEERQTYLHERP